MLMPSTNGGDTVELPILQIEGLNVRLGDSGPLINSDIWLSVMPGKTLGIVGESGSGKSVLCRTIMRLLPGPPAFVTSGHILFEGRNVLELSDAEMRGIRASGMAMIFQNPMNSLNPVAAIGGQITESLRVHRGVSRREARKYGLDLLRQTGIPSPEQRFDQRPFEWSGGMLQRAVIAMAMAGRPRLMLADEPTTALDATIQDQILALLLDLQAATGMAMIIVSHDMGVIAETCDTVAVMYAGSIVESGSIAEIFDSPAHPYTRGLIDSIPRIDRSFGRLPVIPGQPSNIAALPAGCPFAERCPVATADCGTIAMELRAVAGTHHTACLHPERTGRAVA